MRKFLFALTLIFAAAAVYAQQDSADVVKVGDRMPEFTILHDNGKTVKSADLNGKVVLVNFFATWCGPCQKKLAIVKDNLWPKYRNADSFVMLTLGREHSDKELSTYNKEKGFEFPLYPDKNRAIFDSFAKSLIPRSYIIDRNGYIVYASTGYTEDDFAAMMNKLNQLLQ